MTDQQIQILFYGNCQIKACLYTLNLPSNYITQHIECYNTEIGQDEFTELINKCDIIITQPIQDNYRNKLYLSTSYIINNKKNTCKIILFDSCYFSFYYFDITYAFFNGNAVYYPTGYHYDEMINCYKKGHSIDYYIKNIVENIELKTEIELELIAKSCLDDIYSKFIQNKLKYEKENVYIFSIFEYVKKNYKHKLLFYSTNHPSYHVIQFICKQIIEILQIKNTINYEIDLLIDPKCILYKCIKKHVKFEIDNFHPCVLNNTDIKTITQLYYNTYYNLYQN